MDRTGSLPTRPTHLITRGPFARRWWAGLMSSVGDWVALFATIALADEIGGLRGILVPLAARLLPGLFGTVGGVLADRVSRRVIMVTADAGRALLVLSLVFVTTLPQLFVVSFLLEVLTLIWQPAREASVPNLVAPGRMVTANSLTLIAAYGTLPVGSAIFSLITKSSGLLPDLAGFGTELGLAFTVDSVTFLGSAALVATIAIPTPSMAGERKAMSRWDWRAPVRDLAAGIRFVASEPTVRGVILGMATALFGAGAFFILGQPFARTVLLAGNSGFGILITALGAGVGLGMLGLAALGSVSARREVGFSASLMLTGVAITLAATTSTVGGAAGWIFLGGIGAGASYVMGFTYLHEEVDDTLRGRTFAALYTLVRTSLLISIAVAGLVADLLNGLFPPPFESGIRVSLLLGGTIVLLAGVVTFVGVWRALRPSKLTDTAYQSLKDASDVFTSIRGRRRSPDDR